MFLGNFTLGSIISAGSIIREDRVRSEQRFTEVLCIVVVYVLVLLVNVP